jgi:hypothetical protein
MKKTDANLPPQGEDNVGYICNTLASQWFQSKPFHLIIWLKLYTGDDFDNDGVWQEPMIQELTVLIALLPHMADPQLQYFFKK